MSAALHWDCMFGALLSMIFAFAAGYRIGQRGES